MMRFAWLLPLASWLWLPAIGFAIAGCGKSEKDKEVPPLLIDSILTGNKEKRHGKEFAAPIPPTSELREMGDFHCKVKIDTYVYNVPPESTTTLSCDLPANSADTYRIKLDYVSGAPSSASVLSSSEPVDRQHAYFDAQTRSIIVSRSFVALRNPIEIEFYTTPKEILSRPECQEIRDQMESIAAAHFPKTAEEAELKVCSLSSDCVPVCERFGHNSCNLIAGNNLAQERISAFYKRADFAPLDQRLRAARCPRLDWELVDQGNHYGLQCANKVCVDQEEK